LKEQVMSAANLDDALGIGATKDHQPSFLNDGCDRSLAKMKERQASKIREFKEALVASGFVSLDQQARVLGLCRSSAWSILKGNHKASGLTATTVSLLLRAPQLPEAVRAKVVEYIEERIAGLYGHSKAQRGRFIDRLSAREIGQTAIGQLILPGRHVI
jgi:hypothetical protein